MHNSNYKNSSNPSSPQKTNKEYLQKTILMKNQHIDKLLQELKLTQQLHANLKKKYLADEQKLKQKLNSLHKIVQELRLENIQLVKKYKELDNNVAFNEEKYNKMSIHWEKEVKALQSTVQRLKIENAQLEAEKKDLIEQVHSIESQNVHLEQKIKLLNEKVRGLEERIQDISTKHNEKQQQLKKWNSDLACTLKAIETKNCQRKRVALDEIQSKIRGIMINM